MPTDLSRPPQGKRLTEEPKDSKVRARAIKKFILQEEARVRKEYPILKYQDAIAMAWFLGSIVLIFAGAYAYLTEQLPWYAVVFLITVPKSILHELEHDLIHGLYFGKNKKMQNIMFGVIWLLKFHGNPWWRKDIHHWHHRVSGQTNDIEERILGLGIEPGLRRLGVNSHPVGFMTELLSIKAAAGDKFDLHAMVDRNVTVVPLVIMQKLFLPTLLAMYLMSEETAAAYGISTYVWPFVRDFTVLVLLPMVLRAGSLNAMSTGSHYYGDIPSHNAYFQNQILDHWSVLPFQMFCWFFGATHIIHHYIPNQPFYLRSLISKNVFEFMQEKGVRKNDWGIIRRANRWHVYEEHEKDGGMHAFLWFSAIFLSSFVYVFLFDIWLNYDLVKVLYYKFTTAHKAQEGVPKIE